MNPILKDELVRRYFQCGPHPCGDHNCDEVTALRVLDAMCQPVKYGDAYVFIRDNFGLLATDVRNTAEYAGFHPDILRLPDSHQEPDYEKELADMEAKLVLGGHAVKGLIDLARKAERQKMEKERR